MIQVITIKPIDIIALIIGLFTFWVGIYQLSQNVRSFFSWLIFLFFLASGIVIFSDPILNNAPTVHSYIIWQKITDWPLFLMPTFLLNISIYINRLTKKLRAYLLSAYAISLFLTIVDLHGGLVLKETVFRFDDYRRIDGYAPGVLMIPFVIFCVICFVASIYYFNAARKAKNNQQYLYPIIGLSILTPAAIFVGAAFYIKIESTPLIFNLILISGISPIVYFIIRDYQLVNNERNIFDKSFVYRSLVLAMVVALYLFTFMTGHNNFSYSDLIFSIVLVILIITSHSLYDWVMTFINDLLYNPDSGLSVVSDREIGEVVKCYNIPDRLENSSLLQLAIVKHGQKEGFNAVDILRRILKESFEYFKPQEDENRRTKQNLKHHLLKMIALDEAEEGQILWELGFEDYPVRIMTKESKSRPPMFGSFSPADYTYTSRNAYLALKKEAIHDVTWRISYLEKLAKRKSF